MPAVLKMSEISEKSFTVFEGLKGGPFEHTKTFFSAKYFKKFSSTFIKNVFYTNSKLFSQKYAGNKKERNIDPKV